MADLDNAKGAYKSLLYIGQFVLKTSDVEGFVTKRLPNLLTRLGINDEAKRSRIIEQFNIVLLDFQLVKAGLGETVDVLARTSRNGIRTSLVVFGALTTLTGVKNLLVNLLKNKKLDSRISRESFKGLGLVSISLGNLLSAVPRTELYLKKLFKLDPKLSKKIATFLTAWISFQIYPKGYSRDLLSIYVFIYGLESLQNYKFQKGTIANSKRDYPIINELTQTWTLIPLLLSELYHTYITNPQHSPNLVRKLFDAQLGDIYDSKPSWYNGKQWPSTTEINQLIKKTSVLKDQRLSSTIIRTDVSKITSIQSPLHTNKILSLTNPLTPNVLDILKNFIPKKYGKLLLYLVPFYITKDLLTKKLTIKTLKENWKQYILDLFKSVSKLSAFTILTTITTHLLTSRSENYRLIGFIAGLWGILYRQTANKPLVTYALRVTLLSLWRRKLQTDFRWLEKYNLDVLFNSIGWTILVGLYDNGLKEYISPKRFTYLSQLISTGGDW